MVNGMQISTTIAKMTGGKWLPTMTAMGIILIPIFLITEMMFPRPLWKKHKKTIPGAGIIITRELNIPASNPFSRLALTSGVLTKRYMLTITDGKKSIMTITNEMCRFIGSHSSLAVPAEIRSYLHDHPHLYIIFDN